MPAGCCHFLSLINEDDGLKGGYFNRSNDSADSGGVLDTTGGVLESYYMSASSDSVGFVGTYQVGSNGTREMWAIGIADPVLFNGQIPGYGFNHFITGINSKLDIT